MQATQRLFKPQSFLIRMGNKRYYRQKIDWSKETPLFKLSNIVLSQEETEHLQKLIDKGDIGLIINSQSHDTLYTRLIRIYGSEQYFLHQFYAVSKGEGKKASIEEMRELYAQKPLEERIHFLGKFIQHMDLVKKKRLEREFINYCNENPVPEELKVASENFRLAKEEKEKAVGKLISANLRLVISIARRYSPRRLSLLDLVNVGVIGFINAFERFEESKGTKLTTYASWWIRQAIEREIKAEDNIISLPGWYQDMIYQINRFCNHFCNKKGREPSLQEISSALEIPKPRLEKWLVLYKKCSAIPSLDVPVPGEDENPLLLDSIEDKNIQTPDKQYEPGELSRIVNQVLATLSPREEDTIRKRFGIGSAEYELEGIGIEYGLAREMIRQIELKALKKMGSPKRRRKLDGWED